MRILDALDAPLRESPPKIPHWLVPLQIAGMSLAALVAATVLWAWLAPAFGTLFPDGWSLMKANTALGFLLSVAGRVLVRGQTQGSRLLAGRLCALLAILLAGSALLGHATSRSFWLDTLLAADSTAEAPGRMSAHTAVFLAILGLVTALESPRKKTTHIANALTVLLVVLVVVILAGYIFSAERFFGHTMQTRTSPQTLLCMILLTCVTVACRIRSGAFRVLVATDFSSQITRIALPLALVVPFALISIGAYSVESGLMPVPYAAALTAIATAMCFSLLVVLMSKKIGALEDNLRKLALTDGLTDIYNRRGLYLLGENALNDARRTATPVTVAYFDLDGLKEVNDTLGHDVGSELILDFARLLRTSFRSADVIARVGGDEFAVVFRSAVDEVDGALERLAVSTAATNGTGKPYAVSYSVGCATATTERTETFSELVTRADSAMYEQKRSKQKARRSADTVTTVVLQAITAPRETTSTRLKRILGLSRGRNPAA